MGQNFFTIFQKTVFIFREICRSKNICTTEFYICSHPKKLALNIPSALHLHFLLSPFSLVPKITDDPIN